MGRIYAERGGEKEAVAQAIGEHYRPALSGDPLPASGLGLALALADKIDTLIGLLGVGYQPSGSRDPYGLRRASMGIVRILFAGEADLDLRELLHSAQKNYGKAIQDCADQAFDYLLERLQLYLSGDKEADTYYRSSLLESVVSVKKPSRWAALKPKLDALREFVNRAEALNLILANKRIANILKKSGRQQAELVSGQLKKKAEKDLYAAYQKCAPRVRQFNGNKQYRQALEQLMRLQGPIDRFFDEVMVMSEDAAKRDNRLALLRAVRELFLQIADFAHFNVRVQD